MMMSYFAFHPLFLPKLLLLFVFVRSVSTANENVRTSNVEQQGDGQYQLKVHNCVNRRFTDKLMEAGVEKPFICPIMNACQAALRRMDFKAREDVEKWADGKGSIITFKLI